MTKLPNLIFVIFAFWIFCLKYKSLIKKFFLEARGNLKERLKTLEKNEILVMCFNPLLGIILFLIVCWVLLEFNFGNFFAILAKYKTTNSEVTGLGINIEFFKNIYGFILGFSVSGIEGTLTTKSLLVNSLLSQGNQPSFGYPPQP